MSDHEYEYEESELPRSRIYQEAFAILLIAASLFCLLSLLSYEPVDAAPAPPPPADSRLEAVYVESGSLEGDALTRSERRANLCGPVGRTIAEALIRTLGSAAYLLIGLVTFWGLSALVQRRLEAPAARLLGGALLVFAFATIATFVRLEHYGGWVGAYLHSLMEHQFSLPGSYLLLLSTSLIGVLLSTDWLPLTATWRLLRTLRRDHEYEEEEYDEEEEEEEEEEEDEYEEEEDGQPGFLSKFFGRLREVSGAALSRIPLLGRSRAAGEDEEHEEQAPASRGSNGAARERAGRPGPGEPRPRKTGPAKTGPAKTGPAKTGPAKTGPAKTGHGKAGHAKPKKRARRAEPATQVAERTAARARGMIGGGVSPRRVRVRGRTRIPASLLGDRTDDRGYTLPPLDLLDEPIYPDQEGLDEAIRETSATLVRTLAEFKVEAEVVEIEKGPVITMYEVELAAGIKVQRVVNLTDDLSIALKSPVRIVAPIPGKSTVGIEVPNTVCETVGLRELAASEAYRKNLHSIPFLLGKDASGAAVVEDLAAMPHLLIAGATGSGKSVCINSVILSIILSRSPEDVQLILIDPKMVELSLFKKIPHLITPVVTDMRRTPAILEWAVNKMEERYSLLADLGVKNITGYNQLGEETIRKRAAEMDADPETVPTHLPYIVIIVDELADLMMIASKEVEGSLTRLAQKSRAVGVHIIFATQRPSVDVVTGLIKANFPARISFRVSSRVDSRTILDSIGAERLLGAGDLLYLPPRSANLLRCQGVYISEKEIKAVVDFLRSQSEPQFNPELEELEEPGIDGAPGGVGKRKKKKRDALFGEAVRFVLEQERGSVSLLQRQFEIGYSRAARLIDQMAEEGIVGKYKGSKAREVLITLDEWEAREQES